MIDRRSLIAGGFLVAVFLVAMYWDTLTRIPLMLWPSEVMTLHLKEGDQVSYHVEGKVEMSRGVSVSSGLIGDNSSRSGLTFRFDMTATVTDITLRAATFECQVTDFAADWSRHPGLWGFRVRPEPTGRFRARVDMLSGDVLSITEVGAPEKPNPVEQERFSAISDGIRFALWGVPLVRFGKPGDSWTKEVPVPKAMRSGTGLSHGELTISYEADEEMDGHAVRRVLVEVNSFADVRAEGGRGQFSSVKVRREVQVDRESGLPVAGTYTATTRATATANAGIAGRLSSTDRTTQTVTITRR